MPGSSTSWQPKDALAPWRTPSRLAGLLRSALALWRGTALEGAGRGDICSAEAAQLEEGRLTVLETLYDASLRAGRHGEITGELEELTADHPMRERFYDLLMTALYRCRPAGGGSECL